MISRNRRSIALPLNHYDIAGLPEEYFNPDELITLLTLIDMFKAETVIEFGVNSGRNPAAVFRNIASVTRYVGVDVTPDYQTTMPCQRREIPAIPGELVLGDSRFELIVRQRGTFELTADDLPAADVVFIDADHSYSGVMNDYALARAVIKPVGVIIFHDDNCRPEVEVTQALNTLCDAGHDIVHIDGTWLSYEVIK